MSTENNEEFSDAIFETPEYLLSTPSYASLYRQVVDKLRQEAVGLPMNTVQILMIERIATTYVFLRQAEASPQSLPAAKQSELNKSLTSMFKDFNGMLSLSNDKFRDNILEKVSKAVLGALDAIDDVKVRAAVNKKMTDELRAIGF